MKKLLAATFATAAAGIAQASGDSGTSAMGEMNVSGLQLLGFVGALAVMGLVIWGVVKIANK
jgi:hypothetical protein